MAADTILRDKKLYRNSGAWCHFAAAKPCVHWCFDFTLTWPVCFELSEEFAELLFRGLRSATDFLFWIHSTIRCWKFVRNKFCVCLVKLCRFQLVQPYSTILECWFKSEGIDSLYESETCYSPHTAWVKVMALYIYIAASNQVRGCALMLLQAVRRDC